MTDKKLTKKELYLLRDLLSRFLNEYEDEFVVYDSFVGVDPDKTNISCVFEVLEQITKKN